MPISIRQAIFFSWFLLSWLLLLLLGESYINYVLIGAISFYFIFSHKYLDWKKLVQYKPLIFLWGVFLFGIIISSLFTTNIPATIYYLFRYFFTTLVFWFFLLSKDSLFSKKQFIELVIMLTSVIIIISFGFYFFKDLAIVLPGMNLIYSTYGHSHLAALLLITTPSAWWLALDYINHKKSKLWLLLPMLFSIALLTSFGRAATVISLFQFFIILYYLLKHTKIKKTYSAFLIIIILLFIATISWQLFLSINSKKDGFSCPIPKFKTQLCKSINTESRPQYWRLSWDVFKNNLLIGTGPGTFGFSSKKYKISPFGGSGYAHNAFLQNFAEMGLIGGGSFLFLMTFLLYKAKKTIKISWNLSSAMFLGVIGIYMNILVDFDWDFISIFSLTIIFLAILIKNKKTPKLKIKNIKLPKILFFNLVVFILTITSIYLYIEILINTNNIQKAFNTFPYFHWHRKIYEKSDISDKNKKELYKLYKSQPEIYLDWLMLEKDEENKQLIRETWFETDPWSSISDGKIIDFYIQKQNWLEALKWSQIILDMNKKATPLKYITPLSQRLEFNKQLLIIAQYLQKTGETKHSLNLMKIIIHRELFFEEKEQLANLFIKIGNEFASTNMNLTVDLYQTAKEISPYVLSRNNIWFEEKNISDISSSQSAIYLQKTNSWKDEEIGWKYKITHSLKKSIIENLIENKDWKNLSKSTKNINWLNYDYQWRLQILDKLTLPIENLAKQKNFNLSLDLINIINKLSPNNYWILSLSPNLALLENNDSHAKNLFKQCLVSFKESQPIQKQNKKHDHCYYELQSLIDNNSNRNNFFEIMKEVKKNFKIN